MLVTYSVFFLAIVSFQIFGLDTKTNVSDLYDIKIKINIENTNNKNTIAHCINPVFL
jgi:hypothetical protein